jgi:hypothetical protein
MKKYEHTFERLRRVVRDWLGLVSRVVVGGIVKSERMMVA